MQISPSSVRQSLLEISIGGALGGVCVIASWLAIAVASTPPANSAPFASSASTVVERIADVGDAAISNQARQIANWVANSRDNRELDFVIIDKKNAAVYVFNADAHLLGSSPVLLGSAAGDNSVPGIGTRPMKQIRQAERTTPAGRFIAERAPGPGRGGAAPRVLHATHGDWRPAAPDADGGRYYGACHS